MIKEKEGQLAFGFIIVCAGNSSILEFVLSSPWICVQIEFSEIMGILLEFFLFLWCACNVGVNLAVEDGVQAI
jgi:hypothetical protein